MINRTVQGENENSFPVLRTEKCSATFCDIFTFRSKTALGWLSILE